MSLPKLSTSHAATAGRLQQQFKAAQEGQRVAHRFQAASSAQYRQYAVTKYNQHATPQHRSITYDRWLGNVLASFASKTFRDDVHYLRSHAKGDSPLFTPNSYTPTGVVGMAPTRLEAWLAIPALRVNAPLASPLTVATELNNGCVRAGQSSYSSPPSSVWYNDPLLLRQMPCVNPKGRTLKWIHNLPVKTIPMFDSLDNYTLNDLEECQWIHLQEYDDHVLTIQCDRLSITSDEQ